MQTQLSPLGDVGFVASKIVDTGWELHAGASCTAIRLDTAGGAEGLGNWYSREFLSTAALLDGPSDNWWLAISDDSRFPMKQGQPVLLGDRPLVVRSFGASPPNAPPAPVSRRSIARAELSGAFFVGVPGIVLGGYVLQLIATANFATGLIGGIAGALAGALVGHRSLLSEPKAYRLRKELRRNFHELANRQSGDLSKKATRGGAKQISPLVESVIHHEKTKPTLPGSRALLEIAVGNILQRASRTLAAQDGSACNVLGFFGSTQISRNELFQLEALVVLSEGETEAHHLLKEVVGDQARAWLSDPLRLSLLSEDAQGLLQDAISLSTRKHGRSPSAGLALQEKMGVLQASSQFPPLGQSPQMSLNRTVEGDVKVLPSLLETYNAGSWAVRLEIYDMIGNQVNNRIGYLEEIAAREGGSSLVEQLEDLATHFGRKSRASPLEAERAFLRGLRENPLIVRQRVQKERTLALQEGLLFPEMRTRQVDNKPAQP